MKTNINSALKPAVMAIGFGLLITAFAQSCSVTHAQQKKAVYNDFPKVNADTIVPQSQRPKPLLTGAELNNFLQSQYQYNYDRLFLPQFKKIADENVSLKSDIHRLTDNFNNLVTLLGKANAKIDSARRGEKTQRERARNWQEQAAFYEQQVYKYQIADLESKKQNTAQISKFMEKTDKTIGFLNQATKIILIIAIIIITILLILGIAVILLWKKVHLLRKQANV